MEYWRNKMTCKEIQSRQNEKMLLQCQYASRYYFNRGEFFNYTVWGLCLLSSFTEFFPDNSMLFTLVIPLCLEITAFVFNGIMTNSVKKAAKLRAYFDAYVLSLDYARYNSYDIREVKEIIKKVVKRKSRECQIQISHTGKDNPPGVLNWYELNSNILDENSQYECQSQNCWWNDKLFKGRVTVLAILIIFVVSIYFILYLMTNDSFKRKSYIFLCSGGIVVKGLERLYYNFKYYKLSIKIDGIKELLVNSRDEQQINKLQEMLNERRTMPVFEMNKLHRCLAKRLSELQSQILN